MTTLSDRRIDYSNRRLLKEHVEQNPFAQFSKWYGEAEEAGFLEVNAMSLATVNGEGIPSVRMVLLKEYSESGFVFYTNYNSEKGQELALNNNAALLFYWDKLERQVRISGRTTKVSEKESEEYFHSRPRDSQLAAFISAQSETVERRSTLEERLEAARRDFSDKAIPKPEAWGGYCVEPTRFEFWQGGSNRLHDRIAYTLNSGQWEVLRLQP